MRKKIIIIITAVLLLFGLIVGLFVYKQKSSKEFADKQIQNLVDTNFAAIYNGLTKESQEKYEDKEDFKAKFATIGLIEQVDATELVNTQENIQKPIYTYKLVRVDDPLKGYSVQVHVKRGLVDNKLSDLSVYEDDFSVTQ